MSRLGAVRKRALPWESDDEVWRGLEDNADEWQSHFTALSGSFFAQTQSPSDLDYSSTLVAMVLDMSPSTERAATSDTDEAATKKARYSWDNMK